MIAYFDCFAGASGNMILGALVDAGLSLDALERELRKLPVHGWTLRAQPVHQHGLAALYLDFEVPGEDHHAHEPGEHRHEGTAHRRLRDVLEVLHAAHYPEAVERTAASAFARLAEAEARMHRTTTEEVLFHEVGQIDAILDVAGAALGLHMLGIERAYCSPLPCGRGTVHCAHGDMPSPAPATLELLRGVPTYALDIEAELVTPTGAAILTSVADFSLRPPMTIERIGYGSGRSEFPFPNVLRVLIGPQSAEPARDASGPNGVVQMETNIDDMNPQLYEHVMERLFAAGALDVWTQSVQMKKGRPGVVLSTLSESERADAVAAVLLAETTTLGVRRWPAQRVTLPRQTHPVETSLGSVHVKVVESPSGVRARAEYEDCKAISQRTGRPLAEVMRQVDAEVSVWLKTR
ncbi:MAG TPA: nickel pincer cofactor biosynthesis protein LarC [Candidatus Tumulicola sp.]|nr:nickel pincer cofactor biosynthesis protein LarC [Candidatus Tumulicola sp.]